MTTWSVKEVHLIAYYFNHTADTVVLSCRSVSLLPEESETRSGAGGFIQRSITKSSRLLLEGTNPSEIRSLGWQPQHVSFTDSAGEKHNYPVRGAQFDGAGRVTLAIGT